MPRKPERLPLDKVPPVPDSAVPDGQQNGDRVFNVDVHRWRQDKHGVLLYYIRYSEKRDRQEAIYEHRRRR